MQMNSRAQPGGTEIAVSVPPVSGWVIARGCCESDLTRLGAAARGRGSAKGENGHTVANGDGIGNGEESAKTV
jgi:hypothetical protein